jgi:hypothetical protein
MTCELCGQSDPRGMVVRSGLACYADDGRFERIDRCVDHRSCERRVVEAGGTWPLIDVRDRVLLTTGKERTA